MASRLIAALFGAIPASIYAVWIAYLGFFSGAAILNAFLEGGWVAKIGSVPFLVAVAFFILSLLGLWGLISLWAIVLGPASLNRVTIFGLIAGVVALSGAFVVFGGRFRAFANPMLVWTILGPIAVALWHIGKYRQHRHDA